ncbi:hypothetical protein BHE74_00038160 [Ensete ventricosum]|nr:hypothetical protein BHE74_00038160 [Ensete ventricosum]
MGGLPPHPGWVNHRKYPDSWVRVVQLPSLGGSAAVSRSKAWAVVVHPLLTDGLPVEISAKVVDEEDIKEKDFKALAINDKRLLIGLQLQFVAVKRAARRGSTGHVLVAAEGEDATAAALVEEEEVTTTEEEIGEGTAVAVVVDLLICEMHVRRQQSLLNSLPVVCGI